MKTYVVYARGGGVHNPPNDPCFSVTVQADSRRDAHNKVVATRPDLANAHKNCTWAAHVKV